MKAKPPSKATLRKYGMTRKDWKRVCRKCDYKCVVCGQDFGDRPLAIDHEHVKGWNAYKRRKAKSSGRSVRVRIMPPEERRKFVRGVIHSYCNRFIRRWLTLDRSRSILSYLEAYHASKEVKPMNQDSVLKWHGGKTYLAPKIVSLMPRHVHYVEPYFGGGAVLFHKSYLGTSEVVNDLNGELTNFWRVLQRGSTFRKFRRIVQATPASEVEWKRSYRSSKSRVLRAVRFFVRCRQSMSGRMTQFPPPAKNRLRRDMNDMASAWLSSVDRLEAIHNRLKRVVIYNRDAIKVIKQNDGPKTLFYLDPPYLKSTREKNSRDVYHHEMSRKQHVLLLKTILRCKGKVMISGYPSKLYDRMLKDWTRHEIKIKNFAAHGKKKRVMTEIVWCNF